MERTIGRLSYTRTRDLFFAIKFFPSSLSLSVMTEFLGYDKDDNSVLMEWRHFRAMCCQFWTAVLFAIAFFSYLNTSLVISREKMQTDLEIAKINAGAVTSVHQPPIESRPSPHLSQERWGIWSDDITLPPEAKCLWIGHNGCYGFIGAIAQIYSVEVARGDLESIIFTVPNDFSGGKNMLNTMQSVLGRRAKITALIRDSTTPEYVTTFGISNRHLTEKDCFAGTDFKAAD